MQSISEFIAQQRATSSKPSADIRQRWVSRILARGLHQQGRAGAAVYLRDYGRGISTAKVVAFALQAEAENCPALAQGFWEAAYKLETGETPPQEPEPQSVPTIPINDESTTPVAPSPFGSIFPSHLLPGALITMQPVDASRTREDYIADTAFIGQPKRDGNRIVVFATHAAVAYQSRSTNVIASPEAAFDSAFQYAAHHRGPFILDGELVYLDAAGGEHRTGSQAAQTNVTNGHPRAPVRCGISIFKALFTRCLDLTGHDEPARIYAAGKIVELAQRYLTVAGFTGCFIEVVPTAWNTDQKRALVAKQQAEGREGEVWIRQSTCYVGGKARSDEVFVRTKYLSETEVVITGLTPTTVRGRPFGAIEVSARYPDGDLRPVGRVGTGFDAADAAKITALLALRPTGVRIVVRHQGRTENGMLWHARFLRIVSDSFATPSHS